MRYAGGRVLIDMKIHLRKTIGNGPLLTYRKVVQLTASRITPSLFGLQYVVDESKLRIGEDCYGGGECPECPR